MVLGGGCFWCTEAVFRTLVGVEEVECGYAGGEPGEAEVTYEAVTSGATGHAEVVRVHYDPSVITVADLVSVLEHVRPGGSGGIARAPGRAGTLGGSHWRTLIQVAAPELADAHAAAPPGAEVTVLGPFVLAEERHQRYAGRHPDGHYTCTVITPKVAAVKERFPRLVRHARTSSPA